MSRPPLSRIVGLLGLAVASAWPAAAQQPAPADDASTSREPPETVMFTPDEMRQLEKALHGLAPMAEHGASADGEGAPLAAVDLYLSAVVYFAPNDWIVWVNGERATPADPPSMARILTVNAGFVDFEVPDQSKSRVRLRPNQSWLADSDSIVEGIRK